MSSFVFQNKTSVFFGQDRMNDLPYILKKYGRRILVLSGRKSAEKNGTLDQVIKTIEDFKFDLYFYREIDSNPSDRTISKIVSYSKKVEPDAILAIGGGSVIDSAKAVSAIYYSEYETVLESLMNINNTDKIIPVVAIPTTIGTGSEMNGGIVFTDENTGIKRGFGGIETQPVAAFYNPCFTNGLSRKQIASGAADIIAHVFDSGYFTFLKRMEFLRLFQCNLIRSVIINTRELMIDMDNEAAREELMWLSAWGLNGFLYENLKQDAPIHIIAHQLSADYHLAHGEAVAIVMPRWLRYCIREDTAEQIAMFGSDCFGIKLKQDRLSMARDTVDAFESFLYEELALEKSLCNVGVPKSEFKELSKRIMKNGSICGFLKLDEEGVFNILSLCK